MSQIKKAGFLPFRFLGVVGLALLSGCGWGQSDFVAGSLGGVNHTYAGINWYAVNGWGGKNISPYSGYGGGTCCIPMPLRWQPGMMFEIEWETDPNPRARLPRITSSDYFEAYEKHAEKYVRHKKYVELPEYDKDGLCSLEVHFMPRNEIKLSTSCWGYDSPNSPIKEPLKMQEPATCPK